MGNAQYWWVPQAGLTMLRTEGFEVNTYVNENAFMKDVLSGKLYRDQDEFNIVLNSAQKGVCIGRKSLTPAFCDLHKIWHNNSNAYAVSLCRHKYHTGCLLEYFGYTCPKSWSYNYAYGWLLNHRPDQGARVIAKLNYETSSIGLDSNNIFIYKNDSTTFFNVLSSSCHQDVIVQEFIEGYEGEVPVLGLSMPFSLGAMCIHHGDMPYLGEKILGSGLIN